MSKSEGRAVSAGWGYGYVFDAYVRDNLVGKLLTIVEALGLKDTQEKSVKDIVRNTIDLVFQDAVYISSKRHSEIKEEYFKQKEESIKNRTPMAAI